MWPCQYEQPDITNALATGYPCGGEPVILHICSRCGGDILLGDTYYDIDGEPWCEECIRDCRKEAGDE